MRRKAPWDKHLKNFANIANIFTFIITLSIFFIGYIFVDDIRKDIKKNLLIITQPRDHDLVDNNEVIRGSTPYLRKVHYLVVTPLATGDDWVQYPAVTIDNTGVWAGQAVFGSSAVGNGQDFLVRVVATSSKINPSNLAERSLPMDAISSAPIKVTRKK